MRGIVAAAGYLPRGRLDRATIAPLVGTGGGKGARSVASYDEDTTTMGVEAARLAMRSAPAATMPWALWFSTVTPAYLDKTNATAIHAALRLDDDVPAFDVVGSQRSAVGALAAALCMPGTSLVVSADLRTGLPGGGDEAAGGDGAAALLVGEGDAVVAEYLGGASMTEEFLDRWRTPGDNRSKVWEERFGETRYVALGERHGARRSSGPTVDADAVDRVIVTSLHAWAARSLGGKLGRPVFDDLGVGNTGAAHPALLLPPRSRPPRPARSSRWWCSPTAPT